MAPSYKLVKILLFLLAGNYKKTMKRLAILPALCSLLLITNKVNSQDCTYYFPKKVGTELETKSYNDKDKLVSTAKSKIIDIDGNDVKVHSEVLDDKGKPIGNSDFTVSCKDGVFVMDLGGYLKGVDMSKYKDMDVKVETKDLIMPGAVKPGDALPEGQLTMKISNQVMTIMTIVVKVYNRKVVGMENVTTPAGTFECVKMTYDIDTKVGLTISGKGVEWIAKNVGVVKSESYSNKDKLLGRTELTSLK